MTCSNILSLPKRTAKFQTGDVLFVKRETGFLGRLIQVISKSSFIHCAILVDIRGLWFVIETRYTCDFGYQMVPIEWWLARHAHEDTYLGKMPRSKCKQESESLIRQIVMDSLESLRPYSLMWVFFTYILQVWFGIFRPDVAKIYKGPKPLICSTLIQEAWERAGIIEPTNYMTPGQLVSFIGGEAQLISLSNFSSSPNKNDTERAYVPQIPTAKLVTAG